MGENKLTYINIIKAVIIFIFTLVSAVFIFAAALYVLEGGYEFSPLFASLSLALGGFASSFYIGNFKGEKGILLGSAVGALIFIITTLITLLVNSGAITVYLLLRFIIILLASMIGAILGVNKKHSKKFI